MIFWLDAQLPPGLAEYLASSFHVEAIPVRNLGLRDASDQEIFSHTFANAVLLFREGEPVVEISGLPT
jgi:predicted nuclease of predicted toxin-antitoxin system